jgi:hypothetical protein
VPFCGPGGRLSGPDPQGHAAGNHRQRPERLQWLAQRGLRAGHAWSPGKAVPANCVADLAARNSEAYSSTLFTTHSDVAWQEYFAAVKVMNQQNLAAVRVAGPETRGRGTFELLQEIDSSATDSGTFLKFDAVYRPTVAGQGSWEDLDRATRWYVELVPAGEFLVINYIETKPAAGYP